MQAGRRAACGLVLLAAAVLAGYVRFSCLRDHAPSTGTVAGLGKELPSLPVVDASDNPVDLKTAAMGSRSVIAFYAASCRVCQLVLPELKPFPPSLRLLLVNEDKESPPELPHGPGLEDARIFRDRDKVLSRSFPMCGVPTILFVDERGVLRIGLVGQHARGMIQARLKEFAGERP